jgi:hypothetical protein
MRANGRKRAVFAPNMVQEIAFLVRNVTAFLLHFSTQLTYFIKFGFRKNLLPFELPRG